MQMYLTTGSGDRAKFLRESGLDGELIPVGDWNEEGYLRIAFDANNQARFFGGDSNKPVLEYREWPKDFDYQKWLLLTRGEREE